MEGAGIFIVLWGLAAVDISVVGSHGLSRLVAARHTYTWVALQEVFIFLTYEPFVLAVIRLVSYLSLALSKGLDSSISTDFNILFGQLGYAFLMLGLR